MAGIALFGGTFDPIHVGHIAIAKQAVEECGLQELYFVPNYISPFKLDSEVTSGEMRCEMIERILHYDPAFRLLRYEIERDEPSYTINTLEHFSEQLATKVKFLVGFDAAIKMDTWYRGEDILTNYEVITAARPGTDTERGMAILEGFREKYGAKIHVLHVDPSDASSTEIRRLAGLGKPFGKFVAPEIERYIIENGLYANRGYTDKVDELNEFMRENLPTDRYEHSLAVSRMAVRLAERYGEDLEKARFAGMYHDIAKAFDVEQANRLLRDYGISDKYYNVRALAHSKLAAAILHDDYGVIDQDILLAVASHTTGRVGMSMLEKIVFVADAIDETRSYSDIEYYRALAMSDIDRACLEIMQFNIQNVAEQGRVIDRDTLDACDYLLEKIDSKNK